MVYRFGWRSLEKAQGYAREGEAGGGGAEQQMDGRIVMLRLLHTPLGPFQMVAQ